MQFDLAVRFEHNYRLQPVNIHTDLYEVNKKRCPLKTGEQGLVKNKFDNEVF